MTSSFYNRRSFLVAAACAGATLAQGQLGVIAPAFAAGVAPTRSMPGGSNNYVRGAPMVERLGSGFLVSGMVRRAGDGAPLQGVRIQIWASTKLGGELEPKNRGSVLTAADGSFKLEMEQIVPNFGQPHAHLSYDDGKFQTVFLRPLLRSHSDTSVSTEFVLAPV
jgi:hypothetical protein